MWKLNSHLFYFIQLFYFIPLSVLISIYLKFTNGKSTFKIAIIVHSLKYWK